MGPTFEKQKQRPLPGTQQGRTQNLSQTKNTKRPISNFQIAMSGASPLIHIVNRLFYSFMLFFEESETSKNLWNSLIFPIFPFKGNRGVYLRQTAHQPPSGPASWPTGLPAGIRTVIGPPGPVPGRPGRHGGPARLPMYIAYHTLLENSLNWLVYQ